MRLSVNVIIHQICCGQGRALSLRYDIESNLKLAESSFVSANYHGGSKPPPYAVKLNFRAYIRLLSNWITDWNTGSLSEGTVERSETEGGIKVISNYKNSLSHFLLFKKWQPPQRWGGSTNWIWYYTVGTGLAPVRKKIHIKSNSRTASRAVPTDCRCILIRAKHLLLFNFLFSLFTLLCPSGLLPPPYTV